MNNNVAAIDLGSNSCRLVIADNKGEYILTNSHTTKLSQGMVKDMLLTEESQTRTINTLKEFAQQIKEHGVKKYRAITTAAVRQAKNGQDFVKRVKEEASLTLEVIDEAEEARLNLVGSMVHAQGKSDYICVFDIGGASTEVTIAENNQRAKIIQTTSIPWGVRKGSENFDLVEYNKEGAEKLKETVITYIKDFNLPQSCITIATSSTPLRLASFIYNHPHYNRQDCDGLVLTNEQINNTANKIYKMSQPEMAANKNIGENRSHVFIAGIVLLQTIVETLNITELTASLLSAKDAIIKELINE